MQSKARIVILVLLPFLILGSAIGLSFFLKSLKKAPVRRKTEKHIPKVRVMKVEAAEVRMQLEGYGTVRAKRKVSLAPQISGKVVWVNERFKIGKFVKKDEPLVRIEVDDYQNRVHSAEALLAQAKAEVQRLGKLKANIERELQVQQGMVKLALDETKRSAETFNNTPEAISVNVRDRTRASYLQALSVEVKFKNALDLIPVQLASAQATIQLRNSELAQAKINLERTEILAPFMGQVVDQAVEIGQYVTTFPLTGVGSIVDVEAYEIPVMVEAEQMRNLGAVPGENLAVSRSMGPKVSEGSVAEIRWLAHGGQFTWKGRLTRIEPMDTKTRTIPLIIEVQKPWESLDPGMHPPLVLGAYCRVSINGRKLKKAYRVPEESIQNGDEVFLVKDGKLEFRKISVRARRKNEVIVEHGLASGDLLVLSTLAFPIEGMHVDIIKNATHKKKDHSLPLKMKESLQKKKAPKAALKSKPLKPSDPRLTLNHPQKTTEKVEP